MCSVEDREAMSSRASGGGRLSGTVLGGAEGSMCPQEEGGRPHDPATGRGSTNTRELTGFVKDCRLMVQKNILFLLNRQHLVWTSIYWYLMVSHWTAERKMGPAGEIIAASHSTICLTQAHSALLSTQDWGCRVME